MEAFCEKMKEKVSPDEYVALLEYFHDYKTRRITLEGLREMVKDLLEEYPGFFDEFLYVSKFFDDLTRSTKSVESSSNKRKKSASDGVREIGGFNKKIKLSFPLVQIPRNEKENDHLVIKAIGFCEKVRNKVSSEDYLVLLKCFHDYAAGKITMAGVKLMLADYFPNFMDEFAEVLKFYGSLTEPSSKSGEEIVNKKGEKKPNKSKGMSMTQLDDELTPSYHEFLPEDLSRFQSSGIDELGEEVLNFCCFSKGTLLGSGKVKPKDPDEEMLNKHEDELYEKDMVTAWMRSTKKNAKKLRKAIKTGKIRRPNSKHVNKYFKSYNFRVIERMYKDCGLQMVDQLRLSPKTVLPVLIRRLRTMKCTPRVSER
ncbi:hypothetical protein REPUB_Repub11eG0001300 [Reevesia pubescens]